MENPIERKLAEAEAEAEAEAKAERTADELVDIVFPWIRMAVADEPDSHLSVYVERLRMAARRAIDYYEQKGEPVPAHVLAAFRSPSSKPSEQDDKRFELGPGAVRLDDVDCREVVRCKSCDWVQFRAVNDECARCRVSFADEPAKSGDNPPKDSSPSEQDDKRFELGPGAVRLDDVDCREVVRCKSCDWVQFRAVNDECARCRVSFADEPAKSGDNPPKDSSDFDESLQSGPNLIEPFEISPELLDGIGPKNTLR